MESPSPNSLFPFWIGLYFFGTSDFYLTILSLRCTLSLSEATDTCTRPLPAIRSPMGGSLINNSLLWSYKWDIHWVENVLMSVLKIMSSSDYEFWFRTHIQGQLKVQLNNISDHLKYSEQNCQVLCKNSRRGNTVFLLFIDLCLKSKILF